MSENLLLQPLITNYLSTNKYVRSVLLCLAGVIFMVALSRMVIYLPFTPTPITGQTLGALFLGLFLGRKLSLAVMLTYLTAGAVGLPVFAGGLSGLLFFSANGGYLIGMLFACLFCGYMAEKGCSKSFLKVIVTMLLAEVFIFSFGLMQLSFFLKTDFVTLLSLGFLPFIIGEMLKIGIVSLVLKSSWSLRKSIFNK